MAVRGWPPLPTVLARAAIVALALSAVAAALRLPVRRDGVALRAAFGFVGVAAMIGADIGGGFAGHGLAAGAVLLATLFYAFAGVFGRRFAALGLPPLVAAAGQTTACSLFLLPLVPLLKPPWALPAPSRAAAAAARSGTARRTGRP